MLYILGFNFKSTTLAVREILARFAAEEFFQAAIPELVVLSTCNRFELITTVDFQRSLRLWLVERKIDLTTSYEYEQQTALQHLLQVACGLDSMVLGEPEILGQIKLAFIQATQRGSIGNYLGHLFPFVFNVAKKVRSVTGISANAVSVAYIAVSLAKTIFTDLSKMNVLLVGAGEMIGLVAQYLHDIPVQQLYIANRTLEKGELVAAKFAATAIRIADIPDYLVKADVMISSTASQLPLIGKGMVERVIKARKHKPIFMVDLAVPRDIEPEVAQLEDVYLYNIDDLQQVAQDNLKHKQLAAEQAQQLIALELKHFLDWQNSLQAIPLICKYRQMSEQIRDQELAKAVLALKQGKDPEQVLHRFGRNLTNKLLHTPSVELRRVAYQGHFNLLEFAKRLLNLK